MSSRAFWIGTRHDAPRRPGWTCHLKKQDRQTADEFALLGLPHALDLLSDMQDIRIGKPPVTQ
jgi:hypothetical protein